MPLSHQKCDVINMQIFELLDSEVHAINKVHCTVEPKSCEDLKNPGYSASSLVINSGLGLVRELSRQTL